MKVKKLSTVLIALAMMIVFAQSAFASDPYSTYTNPNGTIATATPLTLDNTHPSASASGQIAVALETDYFKLNTAANKNIKITLKSPACVPDPSPFHTPICVNYDFSVFKLVNGVAQYVTADSKVEGGISGSDTFTFNSSSATQYYIKVFGHPQNPIGTDPFGNPIINHYFSNMSSYQLKAEYVS